MEHLKIELLPPNKPIPAPPRRFCKKLIKTIFYTTLFLLVGAVIFSYRIATSDTSLNKNEGGIPIISQVKHFIGIGDEKLLGESNGRINILLLGIGGAGHEGPDLTDTIIIVSIKPTTKQVAMISIPRDLVVWQGQFGWRKINHANAFGESIGTGNGGIFAGRIISQTFNLPLHYYIKVDFEGLTQIVDILGGLHINVDRSFTDHSYPTDDFYTKTVSFIAGQQIMDGQRVLQYVRSRHGTNSEASDFARARRQQKVLQSLKDQIISLDILFNPQKINALLKTVEAHTETNLQNWEIIRLAGMARELANQQTINLVLDDSPQGLLHSYISEEGAYILSPKNDSFSEISYKIKYIFTPLSKRPQPTRVVVRNGTMITGLAASTAKRLENHDLFVTQIANAVRRDWQKTTVYKLTGNASQADLDWLQNLLGANLSLGLPKWLAITNAPSEHSTTTPTTIPPSDILIILGSNTADIFSL